MRATHKLGVLLVLLTFVGMTSAATPSKVNMVVQTDWLGTHLNDPGVVLLHVAETRNAYDAGHIAGARFLPWSEITVLRNGVPNQVAAPEVLKAALERVGVGDQSTVIVYGDSPLHASFAYFVMDYLGHADATAVLDGGLAKWKAEQRALTTVVPELKPATLTAKVRKDLIVDMAGVQKLVAEKKTTIIDGRPADQFAGTVAGDGIKRGGHIPGAKNLFWMQNLVSKENPVLKPVDEIQASYAKLGAKSDQNSVVYCRTGMIATHEYFTMKLAGFRPLVYSGSFLEWSNAPGTPVETGAVAQ